MYPNSYYVSGQSGMNTYSWYRASVPVFAININSSSNNSNSASFTLGRMNNYLWSRV